MMSRNPPISTLLALSLMVPWCIADGAPAQASHHDTVRRATTGGRIATRPMRAAGARTRSESLGVRNASPTSRAAPAADDAVIIRPMTPVQESAALLMRLPPGKRVVHVAGFAGDIAAYGDSRAAGASGALPFGADSDSGLQRGIERVRDRVVHRMKALKSAGGRVDAFTVEHPVSLPPGPFSDNVLAEAVDAAVLEVFPRAEAPQRGDGGSAVYAEGTDDEELVASDGGDDPEASEASAARADIGTRRASAADAPQQAEAAHWEVAMQERGIEWERVMEDTRQGVPAGAYGRRR